MASRIAVMNYGVLQQIDTPQTLYDHPNNLFVAGFIGSPAMNFFDAKIKKDGSNVFVETETFNVKVPDSKADIFMPHDGKEVIFGLRPEDIHDPKYEAPGIIGEQVEGNVEVTELMGNEIFVFLKSGQPTMLLALTLAPASTWETKCTVTFNMGNMHIFDKETEQAIR